MSMVQKYPAITKAALEIAYDNGGIFRTRSKEAFLKDLERFLATREDPINQFENWLSSLTNEQLRDVCSGGEGEPERTSAMEGAPPFADDFLNDIFDEVV